uniref:Golgi apparatus membrane protein TVP23 homolog n=1 Tax=Oryzias latipes TaxID=8090 RepID=A0A3P9MMG0_ORYLA
GVSRGISSARLSWFDQEYRSSSKRLLQPVASFLHLFFRLVALVMYLLCDWDGKNCESCFFTIIGLLSLDFWYVKNVSGRLLVGLHWWNQIDEDGNSFWVFEAKKVSIISPNTGTQTEARIFWLGFIICPLIWTIFFFTALFSWKIEWLVRLVPALQMHASHTTQSHPKTCSTFVHWEKRSSPTNNVE